MSEMAATSHPIVSPPSTSGPTRLNHVIVKRERGDAPHFATPTVSTLQSGTDLDDRVIISDVRETVISVNNLGSRFENASSRSNDSRNLSTSATVGPILWRCRRRFGPRLKHLWCKACCKKKRCTKFSSSMDHRPSAPISLSSSTDRLLLPRGPLPRAPAHQRPAIRKAPLVYSNGVLNSATGWATMNEGVSSADSTTRIDANGLRNVHAASAFKVGTNGVPASTFPAAQMPARGFEFACELCPVKFLHSKALHDHRIRAHMTAEQVACSLCTKRFLHDKALKRHLKSVHKILMDGKTRASTAYSCPDHLASEAEAPGVSLSAVAVTPAEQSSLSNAACTANGIDDDVSCHILTGAPSSSTPTLLVRKSTPLTSSMNEVRRSCVDPAHGYKDEEGKYVCRNCGASFFLHLSFKTHVEMHLNPRCDSPSPVRRQSPAGARTNLTPAKPRSPLKEFGRHQCQFCGRQFYFSKGLSVHMARHPSAPSSRLKLDFVCSVKPFEKLKFEPSDYADFDNSYKADVAEIVSEAPPALPPKELNGVSPSSSAAPVALPTPALSRPNHAPKTPQGTAGPAGSRLESVIAVLKSAAVGLMSVSPPTSTLSSNTTQSVKTSSSSSTSTPKPSTACAGSNEPNQAPVPRSSPPISPEASPIPSSDHHILEPQSSPSLNGSAPVPGSPSTASSSITSTPRGPRANAFADAVARANKRKAKPLLSPSGSSNAVHEEIQILCSLPPPTTSTSEKALVCHSSMNSLSSTSSVATLPKPDATLDSATNLIDSKGLNENEEVSESSDPNPVVSEAESKSSIESNVLISGASSDCSGGTVGAPRKSARKRHLSTDVLLAVVEGRKCRSYYGPREREKWCENCCKRKRCLLNFPRDLKAEGEGVDSTESKEEPQTLTGGPKQIASGTENEPLSSPITPDPEPDATLTKQALPSTAPTRSLPVTTPVTISIAESRGAPQEVVVPASRNNNADNVVQPYLIIVPRHGAAGYDSDEASDMEIPPTPNSVPSPSSGSLDMVEVIAGLNAVSNAHSDSHAFSDTEARASCVDAPSFDDSVEYPVVDRDGILRVCGGGGGRRDERAKERASFIPRRRGSAKSHERERRRIFISFCPDPEYTVTFESPFKHASSKLLKTALSKSFKFKEENISNPKINRDSKKRRKSPIRLSPPPVRRTPAKRNSGHRHHLRNSESAEVDSTASVSITCDVKSMNNPSAAVAKSPTIPPPSPLPLPPHPATLDRVPAVLPLELSSPTSSTHDADEAESPLSRRSHLFRNLSGKYQCDRCDKEFLRFSELNYHRSLFHTDCHLYACLTCGKKFYYRRQLRTHEEEEHGQREILENSKKTEEAKLAPAPVEGRELRKNSERDRLKCESKMIALAATDPIGGPPSPSRRTSGGSPSRKPPPSGSNNSRQLKSCRPKSRCRSSKSLGKRRLIEMKRNSVKRAEQFRIYLSLKRIAIRSRRSRNIVGTYCRRCPGCQDSISLSKLIVKESSSLHQESENVFEEIPTAHVSTSADGIEGCLTQPLSPSRTRFKSCKRSILMKKLARASSTGLNGEFWQGEGNRPGLPSKRVNAIERKRAEAAKKAERAKKRRASLINDLGLNGGFWRAESKRRRSSHRVKTPNDPNFPSSSLTPHVENNQALESPLFSSKVERPHSTRKGAHVSFSVSGIPDIHRPERQRRRSSSVPRRKHFKPKRRHLSDGGVHNRPIKNSLLSNEMEHRRKSAKQNPVSTSIASISGLNGKFWNLESGRRQRTLSSNSYFEPLKKKRTFRIALPFDASSTLAPATPAAATSAESMTKTNFKRIKTRSLSSSRAILTSPKIDSGLNGRFWSDSASFRSSRRRLWETSVQTPASSSDVTTEASLQSRETFGDPLIVVDEMKKKLKKYSEKESSIGTQSNSIEVDVLDDEEDPLYRLNPNYEESVVYYLSENEVGHSCRQKYGLSRRWLWCRECTLKKKCVGRENVSVGDHLDLEKEEESSDDDEIRYMLTPEGKKSLLPSATSHESEETTSALSECRDCNLPSTKAQLLKRKKSVVVVFVADPPYIVAPIDDNDNDGLIGGDIPLTTEHSENSDNPNDIASIDSQLEREKNGIEGNVRAKIKRGKISKTRGKSCKTSWPKNRWRWCDGCKSKGHCSIV